MTTGSLKIRHKAGNFVLTLIMLLLFSSSVRATVYYALGSGGGKWNANSSWSTVGFGGAATTGYPLAADTVKIPNGVSIFVNSSAACAQITVGQGLSGLLEFGTTGNFTLTVSGDITVNSGATFDFNSNNTRTHTLKIGGNFINNGTVDFVYDINDRVNVTFNTALNSVVSGAGAWTLNNVTMAKTSFTATLEIQSAAFEATIATLVTTEGTYIHNNSSYYSINAAAASNYVISEMVTFKVPDGTMWFSPNSNTLFLEGQLYVNGGTVYVGSTTGNNGLIYRQPSIYLPYLEVTAGFMNVYGGIYNNLSDPFSFKMSGGIILLNNGSSGTTQGVFFQNDLAGSVFNMSGGTIIIEKHNNTGATNVDWGICGTNGTVSVTGGTVQFGDNATPAATTFDFIVFPNVVQPNFKVAGPSGSAISLQPAKNSTLDFMLLSLYVGVNKTFDIRSIQGVKGDSKTMTLTSTYDGVHSFYCDGSLTSRTGTFVFAGASPQAIAGSAPPSFYNLTLNAAADVTLESPASVTNFLTMISGKLVTTSTNILTCTATAGANLGSASSYIDGPMVQTVATTAPITKTFPIGKGSAYRPAVLTVTHLTATSVTYKGEVMNTGAEGLAYNLPSSLGSVSSVRYWDFSRQSVSNFSTGTIQLYYDVDDNVLDRTKVSVVHDDGSFNWLDKGGTGTANITGSITSTSFTSFKSKFALGFPPTSLPIELISFTARKSGNGVVCDWSTAAEINNEYFTIERSRDGIHFDSILYVDGAGNSSRTLYYSVLDPNPLVRDSYYRLKQTDNDGGFSYSDPVHMYTDVAPGYKIFPNPSDGNLIYIDGNGEDMKNASVIVHDMSGREVASSSVLSKNDKELQLLINPLSGTENNTYIVSILSNKEAVKEKILVNRH